MEQKISITEAISQRQSVRAYKQVELKVAELQEIINYASSIEPLIFGTKVKAEIIGPNDVKSMMKWRAPHYLALYAEDTDAGRMSIGYIYEQLVLFMTSLGLGTCWATSISPKEKHEEDGLLWTAVVAFGWPEDENAWREGEPANRKPPSEVYDKEDTALEAARLAPSAMNNQPWYFEHDGDSILVFCKKQGLLKKWMTPQNRIDIGIALGNMKAANGSFRFSPAAEKTEKNGYTLMGEVRFE